MFDWAALAGALLLAAKVFAVLLLGLCSAALAARLLRK
jgi:hypothetical protein